MVDVVTFGEAMIRLVPPNFQRLEQTSTLDVQAGGGELNVAVGAAGLSPLRDYRGGKDAYGHPLNTTVIAVADELAAAAELVMNKTTGVPVALVRGYSYERGDQGARALIRPPENDLFP